MAALFGDRPRPGHRTAAFGRPFPTLHHAAGSGSRPRGPVAGVVDAGATRHPDRADHRRGDRAAGAGGGGRVRPDVHRPEVGQRALGAGRPGRAGADRGGAPRRGRRHPRRPRSHGAVHAGRGAVLRPGDHPGRGRGRVRPCRHPQRGPEPAHPPRRREQGPGPGRRVALGRLPRPVHRRGRPVRDLRLSARRPPHGPARRGLGVAGPGPRTGPPPTRSPASTTTCSRRSPPGPPRSPPAVAERIGEHVAATGRRPTRAQVLRMRQQATLDTRPAKTPQSLAEQMRDLARPRRPGRPRRTPTDVVRRRRARRTQARRDRWRRPAPCPPRQTASASPVLDDAAVADLAGDVLAGAGRSAGRRGPGGTPWPRPPAPPGTCGSPRPRSGSPSTTASSTAALAVCTRVDPDEPYTVPARVPTPGRRAACSPAPAPPATPTPWCWPPSSASSTPTPTPPPPPSSPSHRTVRQRRSRQRTGGDERWPQDQARAVHAVCTLRAAPGGPRRARPGRARPPPCARSAGPGNAHGAGSVIGLAPSATAARELAHSLGVPCENTAKWLHETHPATPRTGPALADAGRAARHRRRGLPGLHRHPRRPRRPGPRRATPSSSSSATTTSSDPSTPAARSPCSPTTGSPSSWSRCGGSPTRGRPTPPAASGPGDRDVLDAYDRARTAPRRPVRSTCSRPPTRPGAADSRRPRCQRAARRRPRHRRRPQPPRPHRPRRRGAVAADGDRGPATASPSASATGSSPAATTAASPCPPPASMSATGCSGTSPPPTPTARSPSPRAGPTAPDGDGVLRLPAAAYARAARRPRLRRHRPPRPRHHRRHRAHLVTTAAMTRETLYVGDDPRTARQPRLHRHRHPADTGDTHPAPGTARLSGA